MMSCFDHCVWYGLVATGCELISRRAANWPYYSNLRPAVQSVDLFDFDGRVPGSHLFTNREPLVEVLVLHGYVSGFVTSGTVMGLVRPN